MYVSKGSSGVSCDITDVQMNSKIVCKIYMQIKNPVTSFHPSRSPPPSKNPLPEYKIPLIQMKSAYFPLFLLLLTLTQCQLLQVVTMFRHGGRYHLSSAYDGNATRNDWGQLTSVGMRQHYNLGKLLRSQYIDALRFIRPSYNHSEVEVYATNVDRTVASAVSQLSGVFPQGTGERVEKAVNEEFLVPPYRYKDDVGGEFALPKGRQSIPVHLNGPIYTCSNISTEINKNMAEQHAAIDEMSIRYGPFFEKISKMFNTSVNLTTFNNLVDSITVDRYLNRPLPSELEQSDITNLLHLQDYLGYLIFLGNLSKAISTSKLAKVLSVFDNRLSHPQSLLKLTLLSGHDTDLFPMLLCLNFSSHTCIQQLYRFGKTNALNCEAGPQYAASIIWELHKQDGQVWVKVKVNGKYMFLCERKEVSCLYSEWRDRVAKGIIVDPTEFCPKPK